jgi:release factor glutamine methyltransferase
LKSKIADAEVFGVDISEAAINLAKENAGINKLDVQLSQQDILNWKSVSLDKFDIIVSNPPYVRESEKKRMEDNVLKYEPGTALFVSDKDPLIFYRAIAAFAGENLNNGGRLYFEINEYLAHEMKIMLEQFGFKLLEICKDISGRDRMIRAVKE